MTTTIIIDGSVPTPAAPQPRPSARPTRRTGGSRLSFGGVLRSERIKLASLRSVRITLAITVVLGLGLSAIIAALWSGEVGQDGMLPATSEGYQTFLLMVSTFTVPFLALIFGVIGVFAVASEYSSGMILSTLAAVPRRTPVFVAKALVVAITAAVTAVLLVAGGLALGAAFLPAAASQLSSAVVITGGVGAVTYLVGIALLAFGVSALLRSTAGGIAVVAGLTFVLPVGFQVLSLTGWEWVQNVSNYLPASLGSTLAQGAAETATTPTYGVAILCLAAWVAAAIVPAAFALKHRDAN